jgi:hypothetical protein
MIMNLSKFQKNPTRVIVDKVVELAAGDASDLDKMNRDAIKAAKFYDDMLDGSTSDRQSQPPRDLSRF